jgi:hypothetical protein
MGQAFQQTAAGQVICPGGCVAGVAELEFLPDLLDGRPSLGRRDFVLLAQRLDESGGVEASHLLFGVKTLRSVVQTQREPTRWTSQTFQSWPSTHPAAKPEPQREVARR